MCDKKKVVNEARDAGLDITMREAVEILELSPEYFRIPLVKRLELVKDYVRELNGIAKKYK